jgi:hypothetical protein
MDHTRDSYAIYIFSSHRFKLCPGELTNVSLAYDIYPLKNKSDLHLLKVHLL